MNGKELKEIRKQMKLSQTKLGELVGVKLRTVQNWEADVNNIPDSVVKLLSNYTDNAHNKEDVLGLSKEGVSFSDMEVVDWVAENFDSLRKNNKYFDLVMQDVETKAVTKFLEDKGIKVDYK